MRRWAKTLKPLNLQPSKVEATGTHAVRMDNFLNTKPGTLRLKPGTTAVLSLVLTSARRACGESTGGQGVEYRRLD